MTTLHLVVNAVWTSLGPAGVFVAALAIDPLTSTILYAATHGRVFKSTDGGSSWRVLNPSLTRGIHALAIDPTPPITLYAGTVGSSVFAIFLGEQ
jgi:hypothetical protein